MRDSKYYEGGGPVSKICSKAINVSELEEGREEVPVWCRPLQGWEETCS